MFEDVAASGGVGDSGLDLSAEWCDDFEELGPMGIEVGDELIADDRSGGGGDGGG